MVVLLVLKAAGCTRPSEGVRRRAAASPRSGESLGVLQCFALDWLRGDPRGRGPGRAAGLSSPRSTWIPAGEHAAL